MVDFLFNYDLWAFSYATWQAGIYMIPAREGYQKYLEAWAESKVNE